MYHEAFKIAVNSFDKINNSFNLPDSPKETENNINTILLLVLEVFPTLPDTTRTTSDPISGNKVNLQSLKTTDSVKLSLFMRIGGSFLRHFLNELKLLMPAYNSFTRV